MAATVKEDENTTDPFQSGHDLPPDLIPEILYRLPVKSLLRFRCVSKPWLALIDFNADFARSHLNTFKNNRDESRLIVDQIRIENGTLIRECVVRRSDTYESVSEMPFRLEFLKVVSSLHGLILVQYLSTIDGQFLDLKVWNPSIRKLQDIPLLLKPKVSGFLMDKDLGLGYDPVAKSYKLVKLISSNTTLHSVAIYALGDDSWKFLDKGSQSCCNWHWDVFEINNAVHFQGSFYFISLDLYRVWDLVRFDLSTEVFSSIRMPDGDPSGVNRWTIVSFDGESSLVAFDDASSDLYAWALDSESMCWTKSQVYALKDHEILHMKKNGDVLTYRRCSDTLEDEIGEENRAKWGEVTSINCERGECKTLQPRLHSRVFHACCYVESLILHK